MSFPKDRLNFRQHRGTWLSYGVLLVLLVIYGSLEPHFFSQFAMTSFFTDALPYVLIGTAQLFVVLTGGIDLSVGAIVGVVNTIVAVYMKNNSDVVWVSAFVLLVGVAAGIINGLLIEYGRIQPILVTLATLSIFDGIALFILPSPGGTVAGGFASFLTGDLLALPVALWILLVLLVFWFWARRTTFVLNLLSIGGDESAAAMNGIPVRRTKIGAYVMSGLFAALAGLYLSAQTTSGDPTVGDPYTLLSIAAVVIGGVRLSGGFGGLLGTVAGAFTLSLLGGLMYFAGISSFYQDLVQGLILLVAVAISSFKPLRLRYLTGS